MITTQAAALATLANSASARSEKNRNRIDELAENMAIAKDQDWSNEATRYTFDDNSVLVVSGPEYSAE